MAFSLRIVLLCALGSANFVTARIPGCFDNGVDIFLASGSDLTIATMTNKKDRLLTVSFDLPVDLPIVVFLEFANRTRMENRFIRVDPKGDDLMEITLQTEIPSITYSPPTFIRMSALALLNKHGILYDYYVPRIPEENVIYHDLRTSDIYLKTFNNNISIPPRGKSLMADGNLIGLFKRVRYNSKIDFLYFAFTPDTKVLWRNAYRYIIICSNSSEGLVSD